MTTHIARFALVATAYLVIEPTEGAEPAGTMACKALQRVDFGALQDAPTRITASTLVSASDGLPEHCRATGYIAPSVGIEILLPHSSWNGKFIEVGCGGYCGHSSASFACYEPLQRGYACIASDMGHQGAGADAEWAYNNLQAEVDYGFRATHVTALAGKAITGHYYGNAPTRSYFIGCSGGGRQGLVEAQRFPWDFDGIVAGAPAINMPAILLNLQWASSASVDENGEPIFTATDVQLLHEAALGRCDMDDGVKDGVIGNPRACAFDPSTLICQADKRADCLSSTQVQAARKIYDGPRTSEGKSIFIGGAMPGAELAFLSYQNRWTFSRDFFRYLAFLPDAGPTWESGDFDFDHDFKRLGMMEALLHASDPDLRQYKQRGGKLILYHGWVDAGAAGIAPLKTVDYYEMVERTMGSRAATQEFVRLFMIPGMGHCARGGYQIDYLSYLEAWVERGAAPDMMVAARVPVDEFMKSHPNFDGDAAMLELTKFMLDPANRIFTRPVYPYPGYAKYKGTGDPNRAENFLPAEMR